MLILCPVEIVFCFFLMIRRPPRSTLDRSSAASDVYKRQIQGTPIEAPNIPESFRVLTAELRALGLNLDTVGAVSYTHLRAHETVLDLVCRLLLEKKKQPTNKDHIHTIINTYTYIHHINIPTI